MKIAAQVIDDQTTGIKITIKPSPTGGCLMFLEGEPLPHGNRDYAFDEAGKWTGQGTRLV